MPHDPEPEPVRMEDLAGLDLEPEVLRRIRILVSRGPEPAVWRAFLDRLVLLAGILLGLAGLLCFFAFNWKGLHRFGKLGLVGGALGAAAAMAWRKGPERTSGRVALACACALAGICLAVTGQVYQTGADSFEWFRAWSLVILPWVILARLEGFWAFWILLANLWLGLRWEQTGSGVLGWDGWVLTGLNGAAWLAREAVQGRLPWTRGRWFPRLLVVPALGFPLFQALAWILVDGRGWPTGPLALGLTLALGGTLIGFFRERRRDLFMVTVALGSGVALATTALARILMESFRDACAGVLLLGLLLAAQVGGAAAWLLSLCRKAR